MFYSILGIPRDASPDEVKRQYKKLCQIHHPDKGGDIETFKEIREAYDYIIEHPYVPPVKSSFSDHVTPEVKTNGVKSPFVSAFDRGFGIWEGEQVEIYRPVNDSDIKEFGFGGYNPAGSVIYKIPLEVAYNGGKIGIHIPNFNSGEIKLDPLTVDGTQMSVSLLGKASWLSRSMSTINLIIRIVQHEIFDIQDGDLHCTFSLKLLDILGRVPLRLPHPDGKRMIPVQIPDGFEIGQKIEIPEMGFPHRRNLQNTQIGSIFISVHVKLPELSELQLHRMSLILNE